MPVRAKTRQANLPQIERYAIATVVTLRAAGHTQRYLDVLANLWM